MNAVEALEQLFKQNIIPTSHFVSYLQIPSLV